MIHLLAAFAGAYCITAVYAMSQRFEPIQVIQAGLFAGSLAITLRYYIIYMMFGIPI
jgi:hypothetical protein